MVGAGLECSSRARRFLFNYLLPDLFPMFEHIQHIQFFSHLPYDSFRFFLNIKFHAKTSPKSPVEVKALGGKRGDDIRLSCCTRASGDVVIKTKP